MHPDGKGLLRLSHVRGTVLHTGLLAVTDLSIPCFRGSYHLVVEQRHLLVTDLCFIFFLAMHFASSIAVGCGMWLGSTSEWYRMCLSRPGPKSTLCTCLHTCSSHSLMSTLGKKDTEEVIESVFSDKKTNYWT